MITLFNSLLGSVLRHISVLIRHFFPSVKSNFCYLKKVFLENTVFNLDGKETLVLALVTIEDKRFFNHKGVDFYSVFRAIYRNLCTGRLEGASTITQQLVRVITNEREITLNRKIKEILLASLIEKEFSKVEVINAYLLTCRLSNLCSLDEFCQIENYNLNQLSFIDSIEIAARFKYPNISKTNYIKYLKRVRTIEIRLNTTSAMSRTDKRSKMKPISNQKSNCIEILNYV